VRKSNTREEGDCPCRTKKNGDNLDLDGFFGGQNLRALLEQLFHKIWGGTGDRQAADSPGILQGSHFKISREIPGIRKSRDLKPRRTEAVREAILEK